MGPNSVRIGELVKKLDPSLSGTEARRLIQEGAISIDGKKITNLFESIDVQNNMQVKIGKHKFFKIIKKH